MEKEIKRCKECNRGRLKQFEQYPDLFQLRIALWKAKYEKLKEETDKRFRLYDIT